MFYKKFLDIIDDIGKEVVEEFDFWLATLPEKDASCIEISSVALKLNIRYSIARALVIFAENAGILSKKYKVICKNEECGFPLAIVDLEHVVDYLGSKQYCFECDEEYVVTQNNIIIIYCRVKDPNVPEEEIEKEIFRRLGFDSNTSEAKANFHRADLLGDNLDELYYIYYHPDESAYSELKSLKQALDMKYDTKKETGDAYEKLVLKLFRYVKVFKPTNEVRTLTNQIDCTISAPLTTMMPSVFQKLAPYFIIECKNERNKDGRGKTPSNTYFHKLSDIMETNEAQVGIVFSRGDASKEDNMIAYNTYLLHKMSKQQKFLLSMTDSDLDQIIEKRVNLLRYLEFKILCLTMNTKNFTYDKLKN